MRRTVPKILCMASLAWATGACDDTTGVGEPADVTLSFVATAAASGASAAPDGPAATAHGYVERVGANGALVLDEMQLVVDELELEGRDEACAGAGEEGECAPFEAAPYFLDLLLDEIPVELAAAPVPDGTYHALKLETRTLASSAEREGGGGLMDEVTGAYPDWPGAASLRVAGSFQPEDGSDPRPFVAYFEAEVKVELTFEPALVLTEEDEEAHVTVGVDPLAWFVLDDGGMLDLSAHDYAETGQVLKLEAKLLDGFTKLEVGP